MLRAINKGILKYNKINNASPFKTSMISVTFLYGIADYIS